MSPPRSWCAVPPPGTCWRSSSKRCVGSLALTQLAGSPRFVRSFAQMGFWANHVLPRLIEKACRSRTILAERRRWIPRAHGDVLELGVGSGLNLPFYDAARVAKVTGVDISRPLLRRARPRAEQAPVPVDLIEASAE